MGRQSFSVYLFLHHGNRSFACVQDGRLSFLVIITLNVFCYYDGFRTPSLERRQECCVRKQVNGNMTLSEESIILMTPYRLPHHGNRSFTDATDDVLPSAVILSRGKNVL